MVKENERRLSEPYMGCLGPIPIVILTAET